MTPKLKNPGLEEAIALESKIFERQAAQDADTEVDEKVARDGALDNQEATDALQ